MIRGIRWSAYWPALAVLLFAEAAHGGLLLVQLPRYARSTLGLDAGLIGLCVSAYYLGDLGGKMPGGLLASRAGPRLTRALSAAASLASFVAIARLESPMWLVGACLGHGLAAGPLWPSVLGHAGRSSDVGARGTAMGAAFASWMSGMGLGVMACVLLRDAPPASGFTPIAVTWVLAVTAALFGVERRGACRVEVDAREAPVSPLRALRAALAIESPRALLLGLFLQTFSLGLLAPVLERHLAETAGLSGRETAWMLAVGAGTALGLVVPFGRLADRAGVRAMLLSGLVVSGTVVLALPWLRGPAALCAAAALGGGAYAALLPAWNALLLRYAPEPTREVVLSAFMALEQCGMIAGPMLAGLLCAGVSAEAPFVLSRACITVMAGVYALSPALGGPHGERGARDGVSCLPV